MPLPGLPIYYPPFGDIGTDDPIGTLIARILASLTVPGVGIPFSPVTISADFTAAIGDLVMADATSAALDVTLPSLPPIGAPVTVLKVDAVSSHAITITPGAGGNINGNATETISGQWSGFVLQHLGSNTWTITAGPPSSGGGGGAVTSVAGRTGAVVIAESDVTSLTTDLAAKAPLASPTLTGTPLAPTATGGTNTTQIATTAFVQAALPSVPVTSVAGRTGAVVIAESDVTSLTTDLAAKAPLASPALTGVPTAPTASGGTNTTQLATTAFVQAALPAVPVSSVAGRTGAVVIAESDVGTLVSDLAAKAPLASPALTGVPTVPTASGGTNTTQAASTAFVAAAVSPLAPLASPALTGAPTAPTVAGSSDSTTKIATTAFVQAVAASVTGAVTSVAGRTGAVVIAESDVTSLTTDLAAKAPLASPTLTGTPLAPTATGGTNTTQIATTAFVATAISTLAPLASPTLTGTPAAPTAAVGTNTTQIATTAFVTAALTGPIAKNTQTASYTLVLADAGLVVEQNVGTANTLTVPPNSSVAFPIGTIIEVCQYGAGQVTITAGAGVTIRNPSSLTTRVQYSTVSLRKRATDEWVLSGDLT